MGVQVNQESPHDHQQPRPRQDRSDGHRSPTNRREGLRRTGDGLLAATRGGGCGSVGSATPAGSALDLLADELVRRVHASLESVVTTALERVLEQRQAPALHDRQSLARELRCGVDTIDKLRREGMPELRVGDAPRFELGAVLAYLRARAQDAR